MDVSRKGTHLAKEEKAGAAAPADPSKQAKPKRGRSNAKKRDVVERGEDKLISLTILKVLQEDPRRSYTRGDLAAELDVRGVGGNEDTVTRNLDALKKVFGDCIESRRGEKNRKYWQWVGSASFDPEELFNPSEARYLVDCVAASRRAPERHKRDLVEKILSFAPKDECGVIEYWDATNQPSDLITPTSESPHFFFVVETLIECIKNGTQVCFEWGEVDARGQMARDCDGKCATVMPYYLACSGGNYYLIAFYSGDATKPNPKLFHFRVDFMFSACEACDDNGVPLKSVPLENVKGYGGFNLRHYLADHPYMFSDPIMTVAFAVKDEKHARHHFFERFGQCGPVCTRREDGRLVYPVRCNETVALSWACQFADEAEILEPKELRGKMLGIAQRMVEKYASAGAGGAAGAGETLSEGEGASDTVETPGEGEGAAATVRADAGAGGNPKA